MERAAPAEIGDRRRARVEHPFLREMGEKPAPVLCPRRCSDGGEAWAGEPGPEPRQLRRGKRPLPVDRIEAESGETRGHGVGGNRKPAQHVVEAGVGQIAVPEPVVIGRVADRTRPGLPAGGEVADIDRPPGGRRQPRHQPPGDLVEHLAVAGEEMHPDDAAGGSVPEDPEHEGGEHGRRHPGGHVAEGGLPRPGGRHRRPRRPCREGEGRGGRIAPGRSGVEAALVAGRRENGCVHVASGLSFPGGPCGRLSSSRSPRRDSGTC